ncbi:MAG: uroporphyrinogen decarboxylase family protein [Methanomassiliicoccales archaeon]|jgi:MtaA/CmuA family methyltransferase
MATSKELILKAFKGEEVERIPLNPPFQGYWALGLAGVTVRESIDHPERAAAAQLEVTRSCKFDAIETMWDWLAPVEALGCDVKIPEFGTIPTYSTVINTPDDIGKLSVPDPRKDYRLNASLAATEVLASKIGREKFLHLTMVSPFTLAGELRGVEAIMMDQVLEPDFVHGIIDFTTETVIAYLEEMLEADVDGILLCDPTASGSLISRDDFLEYSQPYIKSAGAKVKAAGKHMMVHICGDTSDRLDTIIDTGADVFAMDYQVDVADAKAKVAGKMAILGNVKPAEVLYSGKPADVRRDSIDCIRKGGSRGFILGAGCDIPPGTPLENVLVWKEVLGI